MGSMPERGDMSHRARLARYGPVATSLALRSDRQLQQLVADAPPVGSGIGGTTVRLDVAQTPVFVKRIPLTDLEQRPEHVRSTANIFDLPTWFQYGVGAAGFSGWRELAAHLMTTNWVLGKECHSFPLLYHWRVLAGPPPRTEFHEPARRARMVAYWHDSPAVAARLAAIADAPASLVLFLEHIPETLDEWLAVQLAGGDAAIESACAMVERCLRADVRRMNTGGLMHFDAHFRNVLTDGRRLYFADLGLATSPRFALSEPEAAFLAVNRSHDACYTVTHLVNALVTAFTGAATPDERNAFIRGYAESGATGPGPPRAGATIRRYARIAVVMNDFYRRLHRESRTTPYPAAELSALTAGTGHADDLGLLSLTPGRTNR